MVMTDLRCGDYVTALANVGMVDAVITDPPYSERTHSGERIGTSTKTTTIGYSSIDRAWVDRFCDAWLPRTRYWFIAMSDHNGAAWWEAALMARGWYVFAPVAHVRTISCPRLSGDGPTSAIDYIIVARPRARLPAERTGSRPGYYLSNQHAASVIVPGGKPLPFCRALVRDYTLPGDTICDPCAGGATFLLAAAIEGRNAVGAEIDPETYRKADIRLRRGYTPNLFNIGA